MNSINNRIRQFSAMIRVTLAAALLLASLVAVPSAQATLFGSHVNPDITAWSTVVMDDANLFTADSSLMTLNSDNPNFNGDFILGPYSLHFDKSLSIGMLTINGLLIDINSNLPTAPVSLVVNLTKYDPNHGDAQFLGNIMALDPLLVLAGFDASKPFGVQFSLNNSQSDNFNVPVPEPSTIILLGAGLLGVVAASRRKRQ